MTLKEILNEADYLIRHQGKTQEQIKREADNVADGKPAVCNMKMIILINENRRPLIIDGSTFTPTNTSSPQQVVRYAKEAIACHVATAADMEELFDTSDAYEVEEEIYSIINEYGSFIACFNFDHDWVQIPKSSMKAIADHLKELKAAKKVGA